jgi:uncharacterized membrane protein YsdA (DUF1294 family)
MGRGKGWLGRPEGFHATLALLLSLTVMGALLLPFRHSLGWYIALAAWLAAVNLVTLGYYGFDKSRSRRSGRRVPEKVLHGLALAGGSPGAYAAMRLFRHKTIKGRFRLVFWAIVVLQTALVVWLAVLVWRRHG